MSDKFAGKQYELDVVHVLRKAISYTDNGTTVSVGWLPPGAIVIGGGVAVTAAFNGDTTNTADIGFRNAVDGTADDTNEYATALALGTAGYIAMDELATAGDIYTASGCEVVAVVTSTASASAGTGVVVVEYVVDNSDP